VGYRMLKFVFIVRLEVPGDDPPPTVVVATTSAPRGKVGGTKRGAPQKASLGKKSSKQPKRKNKGKGKAP
jgi:hypothetical protein